ncbi:MAG: peptidase T [Muribaculaceae bacterium]|nr:peptidase T [Muribaculaceae bacterium]
MTLVERFLNYVKFGTQSDELTGTTPSTPGQMVFAKALEQELRDMGLSEISLDELGYLYATLPANTDEPVPTIGFIAHMDTAPDMSGDGVNPLIVQYEGGTITLNEEQGIVLDPAEFPEMNDYVGQQLIVTDGTTLLGADDKAGIAEILAAVQWLQEHPEVKHGKIRVGFNPDEEIGMGAHHFDVEKFGADWAYTMDGGAVGELEYENFNAAGAKVTFKGRNVHPGTAKDKMVNSQRVAMRFLAMMPQDEVPERTEGYEGFFHLTGIKGNVEETTLSFIIRDHDGERFATRKEQMQQWCDAINEQFPGCATVEIKEQYRNMREKIEPVMHVIDVAKKAMERAGVVVKVQPIRGGTDGAQLSFKGLPCPNIFAGGMNMHGRYEYVPIPSMEKAMRTIIEICRLVAE